MLVRLLHMLPILIVMTIVLRENFLALSAPEFMAAFPYTLESKKRRPVQTRLGEVPSITSTTESSKAWPTPIPRQVK